MNIFTDEIIIKSICNILYVPNGSGAPIHHNRPYHGIVLHPDNKYVYSFSSGARLDTEQCNVLYLPKHSSYTVFNEKTNSGTGCIAINFEIISQNSYMPFAFNSKHIQKLQKLFVSAEDCWKKQKHGYKTKCMSILYDILYSVGEDMQNEYLPSGKLRIITPAMEYIHENYFKGTISIEYLSKLCGISSTYFRTIFHSVHGVSPIKYINLLKIKLARELLRSGVYTSAVDIAAECGFNDDCYFRRIFKQELNMSFSDYKKTVKQ